MEGNGHTNGKGSSAPMDAEQFANYIEKRLSLYEETIELVTRVGMELRLRVGGRDVTADLTSFYAAYTQNPAQIDAVARTFVRVLTGELPTETDDVYAALSDRIYPMLKPIALLAEVRERKLPMLVYREFLADLIVVYVIDEPRSVAYINEDHLERWGISEGDLHEQAIENLRTRTYQQVEFVATGEGEQRLYIFNTGDGYDAARLLLTDILTDWAAEVPGHLIVGIPNRDFLIAFSDADGDILRAVAQQVQLDSAQRANGLTDQLFTLQEGQIQEYDWQ